MIAWVHYDLESRQGHLAELMEHVRLPLLPQEYLIQRVEEEPLLRANLRCMLLRNYNNVSIVIKSSMSSKGCFRLAVYVPFCILLTFHF